MAKICQNQMLWFEKLKVPVLPTSLENRVGAYWHVGDFVYHRRIQGVGKKRHQYILVTPMGNRSSLTMVHYGMRIYNNNTIMPSIYTNPEVRYANYLPTPQA
jgi:hypothetical protein